MGSTTAEKEGSVMETSKRLARKICFRSTRLDVSEFPSSVSIYNRTINQSFTLKVLNCDFGHNVQGFNYDPMNFRYPKDAEKHLLAIKSGLTRSQVLNTIITYIP